MDGKVARQVRQSWQNGVGLKAAATSRGTSGTTPPARRCRSPRRGPKAQNRAVRARLLTVWTPWATPWFASPPPRVLHSCHRNAVKEGSVALLAQSHEVATARAA